MADEIWKHDDSTLIRKVPPLHKLVNEKKPDLFGAMNLDAQFLETLIKHEVINQVTKERIKVVISLLSVVISFNFTSYLRPGPSSDCRS